VTAVVVLAASVLNGCGLFGSGGSGGTGGGPGSSGAAPGGSGKGTSVEAVDLSKAVAKQTVSHPKRPAATIDVAVLSLKADGNGKTMTLRVAVTPHDYPARSDGTISGYELLDDRLPYLIDRAHLKRYDVVSPKWASNLVGIYTTDGQPLIEYATYALPQDGVASVDVWVEEYWPVFRDVPIQR
jgi:hypothetical protein